MAAGLDRNTRALVTTITVTGEALAIERALSNVAVDGQGRIYALSAQLGLIRFTKQGQSYVQQGYGAPLPDLPRRAEAAPGTDCSPTTIDFPPIPNEIVFDDFGFAYVTDSLQAAVFRYAPGGGAPQIWFQSQLFEGGGFLPFGANGIRLDPERARLSGCRVRQQNQVTADREPRDLRHAPDIRWQSGQPAR